ncbi:MAG: hypothetical protein HAW67_05805 [Endozoicomonadaceae bacterium]|nr:hypothetical protein [Endozoicomonadaceae bacterium]
MLQEKKVNKWITSLGDKNNSSVQIYDARDIIQDAAVREDWPCDSEKEVMELIEEISEQFDIMNNSNDFSALIQSSSQDLLGITALLSFPRAVRLISLIGTHSPEKMVDLFDHNHVNSEETSQYLIILSLRVKYLARTLLALRIFGSQRTQEVLELLKKKQTQQTQDSVKDQENENETS